MDVTEHNKSISNAAFPSRSVAAPGSTPCEWQPIETVPKDGSRVLLLETSFVIIDEWIIPEDHTTRGTFYGKGRWRKEHRLPLTHWMPLPLPAAAANPQPCEEAARKTAVARLEEAGRAGMALFEREYPERFAETVNFIAHKYADTSLIVCDVMREYEIRATQAERERCAKIADNYQEFWPQEGVSWGDDLDEVAAKCIAAAIRSGE
jgi:hypothetical protein